MAFNIQIVREKVTNRTKKPGKNPPKKVFLSAPLTSWPGIPEKLLATFQEFSKRCNFSGIPEKLLAIVTPIPSIQQIKIRNTNQLSWAIN